VTPSGTRHTTTVNPNECTEAKLGGAAHQDQECARSGMELVAVNARGARAGGSGRQQRCSSSSVEAEAKRGRGAWQMQATAQGWQRRRGLKERKERRDAGA